MRFLVTGGGGYLGVEFCASLVQDHMVTVVDPLWFGHRFDYPLSVRKQSCFDLTVADLTGYDAVIHLAALSNDPMADYDPAGNFALNQASAAYVAFTARRAQVPKFVLASTCSVYGDSHGGSCVEDDDVSTETAYAASKLFAEQAVLSLADRDFSVICLRLGTVGGPSRRMRFDLLINAMTASALSQGVIDVHDPTARRPLLGINDAVNAFELAALSAPGVRGVYNVASVNVTVGEAAAAVANGVADLSGNRPTLNVMGVKDRRSYYARWDKAVEHLGYSPAETLPSLVRATAGHALLSTNLNDPIYYNIQVFRSLTGEATAPLSRRKANSDPRRPSC